MMGSVRGWGGLLGLLRVPALVAAVLLAACGERRPSPDRRNADYRPEEGDIVFQSLCGSELGRAIEGATHSPYSHCGIVTKKGDTWMVLEAIGPVQEIPLAYWILRGRQMKCDAFRLKPEYRARIPATIAAARGFMGRPYDIQYEFDDAKIYCSELVFKAFKEATGEEMGDTVTLGELDWGPHEDFIRRIAGGLPLDRPMITPANLSRARQLEAVEKSGSLAGD